jgi:ABC-2 type transport system permease protein
VTRYLQLFAIQARASLLLALQYRLDFFLQFGIAIFWSVSTLVPLWVLFSQRPGVAGWTWPEALVVVGFFLALKGVLATVIQPAVAQAVAHVRNGTLDFVLLKPADAQFLVSTAHFDLARLADLAGGIALVAFASWRLGEPIGPADVAVSLLLFACAVAILYSLFVLVLSLAFYFVKVDNLSFLLSSIFDAARWPSSVFRGVLALLFTFVIPLALMTTYPALALLGRIDAARVAIALGIAAAFLVLSRLAWRRAVRQYTSAGG